MAAGGSWGFQPSDQFKQGARLLALVETRILGGGLTNLNQEGLKPYTRLVVGLDAWTGVLQRARRLLEAPRQGGRVAINPRTVEASWTEANAPVLLHRRSTFSPRVVAAAEEGVLRAPESADQLVGAYMDCFYSDLHQLAKGNFSGPELLFSFVYVQPGPEYVLLVNCCFREVGGAAPSEFYHSYKCEHANYTPRQGQAVCALFDAWNAAAGRGNTVLRLEAATAKVLHKSDPTTLHVVVCQENGAYVTIEMDKERYPQQPATCSDACTGRAVAVSPFIQAEMDKAWLAFRAKVKNCGACGKEQLGKRRHCSACHNVAYCNRECQLAHWKAHKPVCT